ncbi:MAG: Veg family protein, partial [Lactobacillus iners]|nr:Veg family protein [Lactobacillus iners]
MPMSLMAIKEKLDNHLGQELIVIAQAGRKKVIRRKGVLKKTYPAVFVVDLDQ